MKKLFIIVLYQQRFEKSTTLLSLKKIGLAKNKDNKIYVWDNSKYQINSREELQSFFDTDNVDYCHTPENVSLARIYNICIEQNKDFDVVCIFDQDTLINSLDYDEYLTKIVSSNSDINIFLPPIYEQNKLYSPGRYIVCKGFHYRKLSIGRHKDSFYTAITSGMMIRLASLKKNNVKFNEELTLYGIDSCFFKDFRRKDSVFYLMDIDVKHDISEITLSEEQRKKRTREYLEACLIIDKHNIFNIILIYVYKLLLILLRRI